MDGLNRAKKEIYLAPTYDEDGEEVLPRQSVQ
jgi:NADH dehydrogenase